MKPRPALAILIAVPAIVAGCGGSDAVADHPACAPVQRLLDSYGAQDWDALDATTVEIRVAIATDDDNERLSPLRDAVIGARNDALAETFWIPPDERRLVADLVAAEPADLSVADRRLRADILRTRVENAPERLPDPPRNDPGARAFLASAAATCGLPESS